jgi:tetratricopeptide (TPR) repeat protein
MLPKSDGRYFWLLVVIMVAIWVRVSGEQRVEVLAAAVDRFQEAGQVDWNEVVMKYPTYRDGYVQLMLADWKNGRVEEAKEWMRKVLEVDPNYQIPDDLKD